MNKEQFKDACNKLLLQLLQNMSTAKFYILISSSVLFWFGKLDQGNWVSCVLTVAGLTQVGAVAEIMKGKAKSDEPTK